MQDSEIQKLIQDGVKKTQLLNHLDLFFHCVVCNDSYNVNNRAHMLVCGHFICQQCFGYQHIKNCKFPGCNRQKQLLKAKYYPFQSLHSSYSSTKHYNFTIYIGFNSSVGNTIQNVSEDTTIQELVAQCPNAAYALQKMESNNQGFLIGKSNYLYSNIRYKRLKQIAGKAGLNEHCSNKILIQTRSLGGKPEIM